MGAGAAGFFFLPRTWTHGAGHGGHGLVTAGTGRDGRLEADNETGGEICARDLRGVGRTEH